MGEWPPCRMCGHVQGSEAPLTAALAACQQQLHQQITDSCETDTQVRAACATVLPHDAVYGAGYPPPLADVVEAALLAAKTKKPNEDK